MLAETSDHLLRRSRRFDARARIAAWIVQSGYPRPPDLADVMEGVTEDGGCPGNDNARNRAVLLMVCLAATVVLICAYWICLAPALLAELLVEGSLVSWLCKPAFRSSEEGWLPIAVERTLVPALVIALTFAVSGACFQRIAPQAQTIVEVWQQAKLPRAWR